MDVLVIGGNGFIGSHVVDRLLLGDHRLRVLDRRPEAFRLPLGGVEYVTGDLADAALTLEALSGIDAVVHLASTTVPATSNLDPVADITGNLIATVKLLDAMRKTGVRRIAFLSSGGTVYGVPETDPVAEDHPLRPISSYGIVKVAIENYLAMGARLHGLRPVILRASNPYGPRQGHRGVQGIVGTWLWRAAQDQPVEVWGDGSVVRDYIHVTDLAELCARAVEGDLRGCYNAGSGQGTSVLEILDAIGAAVGASLQTVRKPGRDFDVPRVVLDVARVRRDADWAPTMPLEQGIADTWAWVREAARGLALSA